MRSTVQALSPDGTRIAAARTPSRAARARGVSLLLAILLSTSLAAAAGPAGARDRAPGAQVTYADREEALRFADEMASRHGFARDALVDLFARTRRNDAVIRLITPKPVRERPAWRTYRERFTNDVRVNAGLAFWHAHAEALSRASDRFGVPEEIIAAIIGVETVYGRQTGSFRVFEALSTLAFDYPRRAPFFRAELESFLLFAREQGVDPLGVRGSFAGAIGLPQFMPSSIRRYAIDFDRDGRIDLRSNPTDAIGSVASFLAEHGWQSNSPTHYDVVFDSRDATAALVAAGIEPRFTVEELAARGLIALPAPAPGTKLALVDLPNGEDEADFALGARNFYVITRYNRSSFYAMAVIELAARLREARDSDARAGTRRTLAER